MDNWLEGQHNPDLTLAIDQSCLDLLQLSCRDFGRARHAELIHRNAPPAWIGTLCLWGLACSISSEKWQQVLTTGPSHSPSTESRGCAGLQGRQDEQQAAAI